MSPKGQLAQKVPHRGVRKGPKRKVPSENSEATPVSKTISLPLQSYNSEDNVVPAFEKQKSPRAPRLHPKPSKSTREAFKIIMDARDRPPQMVPIRLLRHIPDHDALLRPVCLKRCALLSEAIRGGDVRNDEKIVTTEAMPSRTIPRYTIAGNHRSCSVRDSGRCSIASTVITEEEVMRLTELIRDEASENEATFSSINAAIYTAFETLISAAQAKDPAPVKMSILNQVAHIRTAAKLDLAIDLDADPRTYGGVLGLRRLIFLEDPGDEMNIRHFLLNNNCTIQNGNKLLRGARRLIKATAPVRKDMGGRRGALDILMMWEQAGVMPTFLETHLSYVGLLPVEDTEKIVIEASETLEEKGFLAAPVFDTQTYLRYRHGGGVAEKNLEKRKRKEVPMVEEENEIENVSLKKGKKRKKDNSKKGTRRSKKNTAGESKHSEQRQDSRDPTEQVKCIDTDDCDLENMAGRSAMAEAKKSKVEGCETKNAEAETNAAERVNSDTSAMQKAEKFNEAEARKAQCESVLAEEHVIKPVAEAIVEEKTAPESALKAIAEAKNLAKAEAEKASKAIAEADAEVDRLRKEMQEMRAEMERTKHEQFPKITLNELEESRQIIETSKAEIARLRMELDGLRNPPMTTRRCGRVRKASSRVTSGAIENIFSLPDQTVMEVYNEIAARLKDKGLID